MGAGFEEPVPERVDPKKFLSGIKSALSGRKDLGLARALLSKDKKTVLIRKLVPRTESEDDPKDDSEVK